MKHKHNKSTRHLTIIDGVLHVTNGPTASSFLTVDYDWSDFRREFHAIDDGNRFVIDARLKKFLDHFCDLDEGSFTAAYRNKYTIRRRRCHQQGRE